MAGPGNAPQALDAFIVAAMSGYGSELNFTPYVCRAAWWEENLIQGLVNVVHRRSFYDVASPTRLMFAARQGNAARIEQLLRLGAHAGLRLPPYRPPSSLSTALETAAAAGHVNVARLLCEHAHAAPAGYPAPPVVLIDSRVLELAALGRHLPMVRYLCEQAPQQMRPDVALLRMGYEHAVSNRWLEGVNFYLEHLPVTSAALSETGRLTGECVRGMIRAVVQPPSAAAQAQQQALDEAVSILQRLQACQVLCLDSVTTYCVSLVPSTAGDVSVNKQTGFTRFFLSCWRSGVLDLQHGVFIGHPDVVANLVICMLVENFPPSEVFPALTEGLVRARARAAAMAEGLQHSLDDLVHSVLEHALLTCDKATIAPVLSLDFASRAEGTGLEAEAEALRLRYPRDMLDGEWPKPLRMSTDKCRKCFCLSMCQPSLRAECIALLLQATGPELRSDDDLSSIRSEDDPEEVQPEASKLLRLLFQSMADGSVTVDLDAMVRVSEPTQKANLPGCSSVPLWVLMCLYDSNNLRPEERRSARGAYHTFYGPSILTRVPSARVDASCRVHGAQLAPLKAVLLDRYSIVLTDRSEFFLLALAVALRNGALTNDILCCSAAVRLPARAFKQALLTAIIESYLSEDVSPCLDYLGQYVNHSSRTELQRHVRNSMGERYAVEELPLSLRLLLEDHHVERVTTWDVALATEDKEIVQKLVEADLIPWDRTGGLLFQGAKSALMVHHVCFLADKCGHPLDVDKAFQEMLPFKKNVAEGVMAALRLEITRAQGRQAKQAAESAKEHSDALAQRLSSVEARLGGMEAMLQQLLARTGGGVGGAGDAAQQH